MRVKLLFLALLFLFLKSSDYEACGIDENSAREELAKSLLVSIVS